MYSIQNLLINWSWEEFSGAHKYSLLVNARKCLSFEMIHVIASAQHSLINNVFFCYFVCILVKLFWVVYCFFICLFKAFIILLISIVTLILCTKYSWYVLFWPYLVFVIYSNILTWNDTVAIIWLVYTLFS